MNPYHPSNIAFIGAGGDVPRVDFLNPDTGEVRNYTKLPPMHSVYAVDIETTGTLAIGTRSGLVRLQNHGYEIQRDKPNDFNEFCQGAPILSVCWCNGSILAASDSTGRCLLWNNNRVGGEPFPLETADGVICSLVNLSNGLLAGCSSEGKMFFWEIPKGQLVRVIDIPTPPSMCALVQMVYWDSANVLMCPGPDGQLTLYDLETSQIKHLDAHQGDLYAVSIWDESLLTLGMQDARLKLWRNSEDNPIQNIDAPKGIISMAVSGYQPAKIVLINVGGKASVYTLEQDGLKLVNHVQGKGYRVIAAQKAEKIRIFEARKREAAANEALNIIRKNTDRGSFVSLEEEHSKLINLGYEHVSLAIKAEQAAREENIPKAIEFYNSLMTYLPPKQPNSFLSMEKYAAMLKISWHITEARSIYETILRTKPDYPVLEKLKNLTSIEEIIVENSWVIEPDISMDVLIESANILEKKFMGQYALTKLSPKSCKGVSLNPEIIVSKYDQIRNEDGNGKMPAARIERLWWISRTGFEELELVLVGDGADNAFKQFKYVLQVFSDDSNTMIIPVILFDWQYDLKGASPEEGNRKASEMLKRMKGNDLCNTYLMAVHKGVDHALRRLITENSSKR